MILLTLYSCNKALYVQNEINPNEYEVIAAALNELNMPPSLDENVQIDIILDSTFFVEPKPWLIDRHRVKYSEEDYLIQNLIQQRKIFCLIPKDKIKST
ncbi:MAG: hypothetical protein L0Y77_09905 [Chlorobi bacterium]|nr:hypothetical protein [Chlorobiota bacterium]